MKATLGQIRIAIGELTPTNQLIPGPLTKLAEMQLPIRTAFSIKRITDFARAEYDRAEKLRSDLVRKYGAERANGDWQVGPEKIGEYATDYSELLKAEVEFPAGLKPLTVDELESAQLSGNDLIRLDWLIVEAEEAKPATVAEISEKRKSKKAAA